MRRIWGGTATDDAPAPAGGSLLSRAAGLPAPPAPGPGAGAADIHAWIDRAMRLREDVQGVLPACRAGCPDCCSQAVGVSGWEEDRVSAAAAALPPPVLAGVRSRLAGALAQARTAGVLDGLSAPWPAARDLRLRWRRLGVACPLLDPADGRCLVWTDRPAVCRAHNVIDGPEGVCDVPGACGVAIPYMDVLAEAGRIAGDGRRWLPAVLAGRIL